MGISLSRVAGVSTPQLDAVSHVDGKKTDRNTSLLPSHEIERWEKTYRERFARRLIFSFGSYEPFWNLLLKLPVEREPKYDTWKFPLERYSHHSKYQCTPRYAGPTPEPLSAELEAGTRQELVCLYHRIRRRGGLRNRLYQFWLPRWAPGCAHVPYLSHGEALPPGLLRENLLSQSWLNQTTAVYFEPEFMRCFAGQFWDDGDAFWGNGCGYIARALLVAWLEVDDNDGETSNLQQMRYFANPITLKGQPADGRHGATGDAVCTHKIICEELQNVQNKPISSKDPYTWVEHGCEMGPVYRSVIIIVDQQRVLRRGEDEAEQRDILFEQCSVLLVRTGDEDHLSAPIDLSALAAAGLTLPLGRSEAALADPDSRQQVVRVRVRTAVRFIMDLERRERDASARLTAMRNVVDVETLREAEAWAAGALANAEKKGSIDHDRDTWRAVRLARARLDGDRCGLESPPIEERDPLRGWW